MGSIGDVADPIDFTKLSDLSVAGLSQVLREQVDDVCSELSIRQRTILQLRFGLDGTGRSKTLKEVGEAIGRSKSTVWRIEREAIRKLRSPGRVKRLKDYIE